VAGVLLGQSASYGLTQQVTIVPGVTGDAPAPVAGASYSLTLGDYDFWRLIACYFELTTDGNAANRFVSVQYLDGAGKQTVQDGMAKVVAASQTSVPYSGSILRGTSEFVAGSPVFFPLSGLWLEAGRTVKINIGSIQAADTLANISLTFDRVCVDPAEYGANQGSDLPE